MNTKERFRDTGEAVAYLAERGVPSRPQTFVNYRHAGGGPRFHRFGRRVLYAESELEHWLRDRLGSPLNNTSEVAKQDSGQQDLRERQARIGE